MMQAHFRSRGFTIVELMVVVAVLGVLAAVAIPAFYNYIKKSRNAEATGLLAEIRLKQEAYRSTFHQYCCQGNTCPVNPARSGAAQWAEPMSWDDTVLGWKQLGLSKNPNLWFSYQSESGAPGDAVTQGHLDEFGVEVDNDYWYVAIASQDVDGDGLFGCFVVQSGVNVIKSFDPGEAACEM